MEKKEEIASPKTFAISLLKIAIFGSIAFVLTWYCWNVVASGSQSLLQWLTFAVVLPVIVYSAVKTLFAATLAVIDIILFLLTIGEYLTRPRD